MSPLAASKSPDLGKLLSTAQLPALPQSAVKLLELSKDAENGPPEFAAPIEADPGLTSQVLRFVNSSYFGFAREITSIRLGIMMVGVRTIKNFALWSAVFSLMPNPKCGPFDLKRLWQDSLRRALFSREFCKLMGLKEAEEAFSAALLQDMAVPLLAKELPAEYTDLLTLRAGGERRLSDVEQERFGWTHAGAAAIMARNWNLPATFAELIERHVDVETLSGAGDTNPVQVAVTLSSLLPSGTDPAWLDGPRFDEAFRRWAPEGASVVEFLKTIDRGAVEFAPLLKITSPGKTLVDSYGEVFTVV